jgi:ribulose bisphosphate carboxylase small subunit
MATFNAFNIVTVFPDATAATTKNLAAGTTDVNSSSIDCLADSALNVVIDMGAITATGTGTFQLQRSDNNTSWTNITGAKYDYTDADTNKTITICLSELTNRYIRVAIDRNTANAVISGIKAYARPRALPVTQVTTANQNAANPVVVAGSYL